MKEVFKSVLGGAYEVSSRGRIRRTNRYYNTPENRFIRSWVCDGYPRVNLCVEGRRYSKPVHYWVALAFLGPRPPGLVVNHRDGVKTNNRIENLEYTTPAENTKHAWREGFCLRGLRHPMAKLSAAEIQDVRRFIDQGIEVATIARSMGIGRSTVSHIKHGRNWRLLK